jgi:hypothetical protein
VLTSLIYSQVKPNLVVRWFEMETMNPNEEGVGGTHKEASKRSAERGDSTRISRGSSFSAKSMYFRKDYQDTPNTPSSQSKTNVLIKPTFSPKQ